MKNWKIITIASACLIGTSNLVACALQESTEKGKTKVEKPSKPVFGENENLLSWVEKADPISDAKRSIKNGNTQLWVSHNRGGTRVYGVAQEQQKSYIEKFGTRSEKGLGDVIYNDEHLKRRNKFITYAEIYNQYIIENARK